VVPPNTLFLTLSQSGETADTLEALRIAKQSGYVGSLTVCNSAHSSMVRESDLVMMTQAGPEIGVASTKAFTTQLLSMLIVTLILARQRGMSADTEAELVPYVVHAAAAVEEALQMSDELKQLAEDFAEKEHTLFLGRGPMWPVAMEGARSTKICRSSSLRPTTSWSTSSNPTCRWCVRGAVSCTYSRITRRVSRRKMV
jgi:glucosamine--fructose-6-phosphate aminotransferase (isomerizing)